jgi:hypothetical protein
LSPRSREADAEGVKELSYADRHIVTADAIADEVLHYAKVLASAHAADTVRMPTVEDDGTVRTVELLIGPSSQITSIEVEDRDVALPVRETLDDLTRRIRSVVPVAVAAEAPAEDPSLDTDYL